VNDDHSAAKMAAAQLATAFIAVGTPEDPNAFRPATAENWKRCALHPIHPVERAPGQTKAMNFAYNWTDGTRVFLIWFIPVLLAFWGLLALLTLILALL
jgi:hypothetical protein